MTISPVDQVKTLQAPALALLVAPASRGMIDTESEASILASAYGADPSQLTTFGDQSAVSADQVLNDWITGQGSTFAPAPSDPTSLLTAYYTMLDSPSATFSATA